MISLRKSLAFSLAERYSSLAIQFAGSLILARLLSPQEIGVFSVASVVVSLVHVFRDFGVSNYVLQEKHLTPDRIKAARTTMIAMSWLLAALLMLSAKPISRFYGEPRLVEVFAVLACSFLFIPVSAIGLAMCRRNMEFGQLFLINTASALTSTLTSIWLAAVGYGFMSLAWGSLASVVTTTLFGLRLRAGRPGAGLGISEIPRVLGVGSKLSGASLFMEAGNGGPDLIVGRLLSMEAVGLLSRATGAVTLVQRALFDGIYPVMIPHIAREFRAGNDLAPSYLKGLAYLSGIAWPLFTVLAVGADTVILFLYGPQWIGAIQPTRILCAGMGILVVSSVGGSVIVGTGRAGTALAAQAGAQTVKLVLVASLAFLGLWGVALAITIANLILATFTLVKVGRQLSITLRSHIDAMIRSAIVATVTGLACVGASEWPAERAIFLRALILIAAGAVSWAIAIAATHHPLREELFRMIKLAKSRRKAR